MVPYGPLLVLQKMRNYSTISGARSLVYSVRRSPADLPTHSPDTSYVKMSSPLTSSNYYKALRQ